MQAVFGEVSFDRDIRHDDEDTTALAFFTACVVLQVSQQPHLTKPHKVPVIHVITIQWKADATGRNKSSRLIRGAENSLIQALKRFGRILSKCSVREGYNTSCNGLKARSAEEVRRQSRPKKWTTFTSDRGREQTTHDIRIERE